MEVDELLSDAEIGEMVEEIEWIASSLGGEYSVADIRI